MRRNGVSDAIATGLLIAGIIIGAAGYYMASPYQTTTTVFSVTTSISTVSVYPVPDNVTLAFTAPSSIWYTYSIQAGSSSASGTWYGVHSLTMTGLFQGQTIFVTASMMGSISSSGPVSSCLTGQQFMIELFVNRQMVAQSYSVCMGDQAILNYTV